MALDGESEESLLIYKKEREMGYVDGEAVGMDLRAPAEMTLALDAMRANMPPPPTEFIGKLFIF